MQVTTSLVQCLVLACIHPDSVQAVTWGFDPVLHHLHNSGGQSKCSSSITSDSTLVRGGVPEAEGIPAWDGYGEKGKVPLDSTNKLVSIPVECVLESCHLQLAMTHITWQHVESTQILEGQQRAKSPQESG